MNIKAAFRKAGQAAARYIDGGDGNDVFAFTGQHIPQHYVMDFRNGDVLNVSDVLQGYDPLADDINDFVQLNFMSASRTDIRVDFDGQGGNFHTLATVFANFTGETVDSLIASGRLVADNPLFASDV